MYMYLFYKLTLCTHVYIQFYMAFYKHLPIMTICLFLNNKTDYSIWPSYAEKDYVIYSTGLQGIIVTITQIVTLPTFLYF